MDPNNLESLRLPLESEVNELPLNQILPGNEVEIILRHGRIGYHNTTGRYDMGQK